ncbi:hypothetical protein [Paraburkholderia tropica]|nr:hypothetical protein [Paraburkholderia tropica]
MNVIKLGLRYIAAIIAVLAIMLIQSQIDDRQNASTTSCSTRSCV